jgi:hypothetical protein
VAPEEVADDLAAEHEVARLVEVVEEVDAARDRREPLVVRHAPVVLVDDVLEDQHAGEEEERLLAGAYLRASAILRSGYTLPA